MKKNKLLRRISVGVAALALICTSAVATSFAKYQTTTTGSDTVEIAKWAFDVNGNGSEEKITDTFVLDLVPATYTNVKAEEGLDEGETAGSKAAPGTQGSFTIVALNNSEVDAEYSISFTAENKPENLKFYYTAGGTEIEATSDVYTYVFGKDELTADGELDMTTDGKTESVTIYWVWEYNENTVETDQETIATGDYDMTVEVTVIGWQARPQA